MAKIACFLVMVLAVVSSVMAEASEMSFDCDGSKNQETSAQCAPYVLSGSKEPTNECCITYRAFVESARTPEERKQLCSCVQRKARIVSAIIANVDALPGKCGTPFIFSADDSKFDCKT